MRIRRFLLASTVVAMVFTAGCTKDDEPDFTRRDLVDQLTGALGMDEAQANCIADGIEDQGLPLESFGQEVDSDASLDEVISPEDQAKLAVIFSECAPNFGATPGETPTQSELDGAADSSDPSIPVDSSSSTGADG